MKYLAVSLFIIIVLMVSARLGVLIAEVMNWLDRRNL